MSDGFVEGPVGVEVPATSANLGPGYDCLGVALSLTDTLVGQVVPAGLEVHVEGESADGVPRDERHLVVRAVREVFDWVGEQPPGLRLSCSNRIPHSRGLGSSSAAIVGGLVLGRALVEDPEARPDDAVLLSIANRLEGHPDNVAPALLGGLVVSGHSGGVVWAQQAPVHPSISTVVLVPPGGVATEVARGLLPQTVPHADAAAGAGRAALLVTALAGAPHQLLRATEDFLHQRYREPAMPETLAVVRRLRERGVPAVVSGAGPTVLAFTTDVLEAGEDVPAGLARLVPEGWSAQRRSVRHQGACVLG